MRALVGIRIGAPTWALVALSRLIPLAAGSAAALFAPRMTGWAQYDPQRLSSSLGSVGNVIASSAVRWDAVRYVAIAEHGYRTTIDTVSYPLYSLLIRLVSWVVPSPVIAGLLISLTAFAVGLLLLHRITSEELGARVANGTVLLLAFAPMSLFFSAVYTESLMLALLVGTFYLARRQRFAWACVAAAGAALTHVEGVLLVFPLALMYWRAQGRPTAARRLFSVKLLPLALPPLAIAGFFAYLHTLGFGWMAPITNANASNFGRVMVGPPVMIYDAVRAALVGLDQTLHGVPPVQPAITLPFNPGFQNLVYLGVLIITLLALVSVWRRLPAEYALFATLVVLVCLTSAIQTLPLEAFDRYMLPIFPLWMGAAAWLEQRRLTPTVLQVSALMLAFYTFMFARWVFIA